MCVCVSEAGIFRFFANGMIGAVQSSGAERASLLIAQAKKKSFTLGMLPEGKGVALN